MVVPRRYIRSCTREYLQLISFTPICRKQQAVNPGGCAAYVRVLPVHKQVARRAGDTVETIGQRFVVIFTASPSFCERFKLPNPSAVQRSQDSASSPPSHVINYGLRESVAYIAGAMPSTFAAICNVLLEVRRRVPGFVPGSVLDFGAGPGTAIW